MEFNSLHDQNRYRPVSGPGFARGGGARFAVLAGSLIAVACLVELTAPPAIGRAWRGGSGAAPAWSQLLGPAGLWSTGGAPCANGTAKWMWADAGVSVPWVGTKVMHKAAEWNPLRWSSALPIPVVAEQLQAQSGQARPVEVDFQSCDSRFRRTFANVDDALRRLDHFADSQAVRRDLTLCADRTCRWMWGDARLVPAVAKWNPLRWSSQKPICSTVDELKGFFEMDRPVEMDISGCGIDATLEYRNATEALLSLDAKSAAGSVPFEFDVNVSKQLAIMSSLAYHTEPACVAQISEWTCESCTQSGLDVEPRSVQVFSTKHAAFRGFTAKLPAAGGAPATECLVSFRGTTYAGSLHGNVAQVQRDLDVALIEVPSEWGCRGCYVHKGFLLAWEELEQEVLSALRSSGCEGSGLVLTGHSLGGALATLAAWPLTKLHSFDLSKIYTFESPRVGGTAFASAWDSAIAKEVPSFRVTHGGDPITRMPCVFGAFRHVMYEVRHEEDGGYTVDPYAEAPCEQSSLTGVVAALWRGTELHCKPSYFPHMCGSFGLDC